MLCYFIYDVILSTELLSDFNIVFNSDDRLVDTPLLNPILRFAIFLKEYLNISMFAYRFLYEILGFILFFPVYVLSSLLYFFIYRSEHSNYNYYVFFRELVWGKSVCLFGDTEDNIIKISFLQKIFILLSFLNLILTVLFLIFFICFQLNYILTRNPKTIFILQTKRSFSSIVAFESVYFRDECKQVLPYKFKHPIVADLKLCNLSLLFTHSRGTKINNYKNFPISKFDLQGRKVSQYINELLLLDKRLIN